MSFGIVLCVSRDIDVWIVEEDFGYGFIHCGHLGRLYFECDVCTLLLCLGRLTRIDASDKTLFLSIKILPCHNSQIEYLNIQSREDFSMKMMKIARYYGKIL